MGARTARTTALVGALGLLLAACGGGDGGSAGGSGGGGPAPAPAGAAFPGPVVPGEGRLSVLAWHG